jgi:hypothetical protein
VIIRGTRTPAVRTNTVTFVDGLPQPAARERVEEPAGAAG